MGTSACERYLTRVTVTAIVITITMNVTHVTSDTELNTEQAVGGRPPRYASAPCKLTISSYLFARWHLLRHVGYLRHQQQVDLWPFDLETGVRVACDVGYLCANFSLPRPLCSRVRPDVRDRQTIRCQTDKGQTKASLNASALWGRMYTNGVQYRWSLK